ncbi:tripartite tricarboxylate transporter substrate binding protein [Verticiella sediminum]|uniref:Tripartite tricarboxylate transporter substrate binding protein n=1 Tax=Verticiella sediminum TaxID=1247510 RepID=A0A556APL8_9BURK|nr:tripartite tricarboxylate transporter substrate binding protein [Verticiella sediminum]TSH94835.1 tripartite tricarboxylate transporter substrate binding protein [Verticiella sediminum]
MQRRQFLAGAALALAHSLVLAQPAYPDKPVRVIVGFAPGGGTDVVARLLAEQLQGQLGQPFVVDNRPGASGAIAIGAVKRAEADGYTLLAGPSSGMVVNPALYSNLDYDSVKDFAPIALVGDIPMVLAVKPELPVSSVAELIAHAKNSKQPLFAASGATSFQLATEIFASRAGMDVDVVSYRGNSQAVTAVLSNEVDFALIDAAAVLAQVKAGALRALAVTSAERFGSLPELPTVAEAGVPDFTMSFWQALFAPAGTPPSVVETLQNATARAIENPVVAQRLRAMGVEPIGGTAARLADVMQREIPMYAQAAKAANIQLE